MFLFTMVIFCSESASLSRKTFLLFYWGKFYFPSIGAKKSTIRFKALSGMLVVTLFACDVSEMK